MRKRSIQRTPKKAATRRAALKPSSTSTREQPEYEGEDIEVCLSVEDDDEESQVSPRKSPKQWAVQTAGGDAPKASQDSKEEAPCGGAVERPGMQTKTSRARQKILQGRSNGKAECLPAGEGVATEQIDQSAMVPRDLGAVLRLIASRLGGIGAGIAASASLQPSLHQQNLLAVQVQDRLEHLLGNVVEQPGQNLSLLLMGRRGAGKSHVLRAATNAVEARFNREPTDPRVGVVRLSGLLHADERVAFREIARRLCELFGMQFVKNASAYDNQNFLQDMMRETHRARRVVIFVLEEWDLFARRPKQTLLYNLLDACTAPSMQAAIVGTSCRSDADQMLEKRLSSRFSCQRIVVGAAAAASADAAGGAATAAGSDGAERSAAASLHALLAVPGDSAGEGFAARYNRELAAAMDDASVLDLLQRLEHKGLATPRDLCQVAQVAVAKMAAEGRPPRAAQLKAALSGLAGRQAAKSDTVAWLSVLELFLLVALARLRDKGRPAANFEHAFDEYGSLRRGGAYRGADETAPRHAAFRAFQGLLAAGLASPVDGRRACQRLQEYAAVVLELTSDEVRRGVRAAPHAPAVLREWLTQEIASTAVLE